MAKQYIVVTDPKGGETISYTEGNTHYSIPKDPANSDYQRYLRWLENPDAEEGGTL